MALLRGLFALKDATRGTTALEARIALAQLLAGTTGLGVRPGVLPISDLPTALVTGTASWEYSIDPAAFVVSRGEAAGAVLLANDAAATIACTAAPGSNSRYDLIWVRHPSNAEYAGDTDSVPVFGVTEGTPAASPVKPYGSEPTGALVLAEALVTAGDEGTSDATITQVFPFAALRGAPILVRNTTERDALDAGANGPVDAWRLDADTGLWRESSVDGTSWYAADTILAGQTPVKTYYVADATARAALATAFSPSASNPLYVWRADATSGREIERTTNGTTWQVMAAGVPGLFIVTPISVAGSGVALSGAQAVMTAATSASLNGVFTSAYDDYRVSIRIPVSTGEPLPLIRLRASGTDDSSANYDAQRDYVSNNTSYASPSTGQMAWTTVVAGRDIIDIDIELNGPALAQPTRGDSVGRSTPNPMSTTQGRMMAELLHRSSTAFDGVTVYCDGADSMTGTVNVYGRTKS